MGCMQKHQYINEFEIIDDNRAGKIVVELNGRLNKCGVISPRFDLTLRKFEDFTTSVLPSRQFGFIVLTTNQGIMDHEEARRKHIGGKVLGFFYWAPPPRQARSIIPERRVYVHRVYYFSCLIDRKK